MKYLKILVINVVIVTICYQLLEVSCFFISLKNSYLQCNNGRTFSQYVFDNFNGLYSRKYVSFDELYKNLDFRNVVGSEYNKKKPIVIFGCSFAYGASLQEKQTFSYKLSQCLKRKVYNRAYPGWGPQDMLYQLRRADFYNETVTEEPEAVIYLFFNGHSCRLYREVWFFESQIFYRNSKNKLVLSPYSAGSPLYGYLAKSFRRSIVDDFVFQQKNFENIREFLAEHFISAKEEMQKHWKNTKFYILVYSCEQDIEKPVLDNLKNQGFKVIFIEDLTPINYDTSNYHISEFDSHPNEKAWDLLTPLIAKKLEMN